MECPIEAVEAAEGWAEHYGSPIDLYNALGWFVGAVPGASSVSIDETERSRNEIEGRMCHEIEGRRYRVQTCPECSEVHYVEATGKVQDGDRAEFQCGVCSTVFTAEPIP